MPSRSDKQTNENADRLTCQTLTGPGARSAGLPDAEAEPAYRGLEPGELWRHFAALNRIPRPSGAEEKAAAYVRGLAESVGANWRADAAGNTVIRVGARGADEHQAPVAVQAHLDMVCERRAEVEHDFLVDAITPRRDGALIYGTGTTLGADNGVGAAAALALLTTPGLRHGPLELLFTVDEERGLLGAQALDPSMLSSRMLINLDGDSPTRLTVGALGMNELRLSLPMASEELEADCFRAWSITLTGLRGGHSGFDIGEGRANALKLVGEVLRRMLDRGSCRLVALAGGTTRNAIPREAQAEFVVSADGIAGFDAVLGDAAQELQAQWSEKEPDLVLAIDAAPTPSAAFSGRHSEALLDLIDRLPHGALELVEDGSGMVKTSANLARVEAGEGAAEVTISLRSFVQADLLALRQRVAATAAVLGIEPRLAAGYPAWPAEDRGGRLIATASDTYESLHGSLPLIDVAQAGLECGVITSKLGGAQAVAIGPLIREAHTPSENVDATTVPAMWALLIGLLDRLAS